MIEYVNVIATTFFRERRRDVSKSYRTYPARAADGRRVAALWTFGLRTGIARRRFPERSKASATTGGLFNLALSVLTRHVMDYWLETESRMRRDDAVETARRCRLIRLAEDGRSTGVRARIADGAQAMSDAFAALAQTLRSGRTA